MLQKLMGMKSLYDVGGFNFGYESNQGVRDRWIEIACEKSWIDKLENIFSYDVPILLEENALKSIRARSFVRFHGVKGSIDLCFGDKVSKGNFTDIIYGGVGTFKEGVVGALLVTTKEVFEELLSLILENGAIIWPNAIRKLKPMGSISFSSDDCLSMK